MRNVTALNPDTGEMVEFGDVTGEQPIHNRRARRGIKFVMIDMETMPQMRLSKNRWTLFWKLVSYVDKERGVARITTAALSRELGWTRQNTSRELGVLRKRNIIIRIEEAVWQINPRILSRKMAERWEVDMEKAPYVDWEGNE